MTRIAAILVLLSIAGAPADEPLRMGPEWFSRLQDPKTRVAALYEREKKVREAKYLDDPDVFAADHHQTFVFPCPQPGKPEAHAVVTMRCWEASREISCGLEPVSYPPHPLEIQRRHGWDAELSASKAGLQLWKPGQPWLDGVLGFLVDPKGTQVGGFFFASPAVIADIDGDGMLDLAGVSRYHLEGKNGAESYADCFEVSSLDGAATPKARFCCNFQNDMRHPRKWRFTVRPATSRTLEIVLVPTTVDAAEVVFRLTAEGLKETTSPLPAGVLVDRELPPGEWEGPKKFLKDHGLKFSGTGSDDSRQIDASLPPPSSSLQEVDGLGEYKWTLPDITGLAPRRAALAIARHHFHPLTLSHYDLEITGDPVPPAKSGWLEQWLDPGWGTERVTVWWLRGDKAERWIEKDGSTFLVEKDDPLEIGRRIAIAHELDRIRLVPRSPLIPHDDMDGILASDIDSYRIRAFSDAPKPIRTTFDECKPSIWLTIGARYDRELSAVLAYTLTAAAPETGDAHPIKELAPVWLKPAEIKRTPPALCRAAIRAIGTNRWNDLEPLLLSLKASLGEPSAEEKALAELDLRREELWMLRRGGFPNDKKRELAVERDSRKAERDWIELNSRLAGDPGFELRKSVEQALKDLKTPRGKK
ncbi:MAG TPA: hypothetical protein VGE67_10795 [Haloferula sp.]